MKHMTYDAFAQPNEVVHSNDEMVDKWDALRALTGAAEMFDVNHRTLGVLKALMTFLPGRLISPTPRSAIVFPSNKTLSDRLNGMPDSTLRRHLSRLVEVGIVNRHQSANKKRFARNNGQGGLIAFGIDLSPLALHIASIKSAALAARCDYEALMALRAQVAAARNTLCEINPDTPLLEEVRIILRRKPETIILQNMLAKLNAEMSACDVQNERHIQYEFISNPDSELPSENYNMQKKQTDNTEITETASLDEVLEICNEFKIYYPESVQSWICLINIADKLTAMMGIDPPVFKDAMTHMGQRRAATVVLCILERFAQIRNPGGYLRYLTKLARNGGFSERPLLDALINSSKLSADNL